MKILIAEDDLTSRLMLQGILTKEGYETLVATDGLEAWKQLQAETPPKVVILDWEMPEMSGMEVCRKVRTLEISIPIYIILLSGRISKQDIVCGLNAGADDYMTKPFDDNELRARIRVAVRMVQLQETLSKRVDELQDALENIKILEGIIPICMHCHKIRNDHHAWDKMEAYISDHSDAQFSHSICPECVARLYPDLDEA